MKEVWDMPPDIKLKHIGMEWLLHLLMAIPVNQRATRICHDHNKITHDKVCFTVPFTTHDKGDV
jgi:hypothetical protein